MYEISLALVNAYIPFGIIFNGVVFNTISFLLFLFNKELNKINSMRFLAFMSMSDTFTLFTYNLDHYYNYFYGHYYESTSLALCRLMPFLQYVSLNSSTWLLTLLTIDKYLILSIRPGSFYYKMSSPKYATLFSSLVILFFSILNSHILMFNGFYSNNSNITNKSESLQCGYYSSGFQLFPLWDQVGLYTTFMVPSVLMITFDILFILKMQRLKKKKSNKKIKNLTISIIFLTVLFMIMNSPSYLYWGYFFADTKRMYGDFAYVVGGFLDSIMFFNHTCIFLTSYLTNSKFRLAVKTTLVKFFRTINRKTLK